MRFDGEKRIRSDDSGSEEEMDMQDIATKNRRSENYLKFFSCTLEEEKRGEQHCEAKSIL